MKPITKILILSFVFALVFILSQFVIVNEVKAAIRCTYPDGRVYEESYGIETQEQCTEVREAIAPESQPTEGGPAEPRPEGGGQPGEGFAEAELQSPIRFETPLELINAIISAILGVIGILSVIFIVWGGYGYIVAGGSEEKIQGAKKTITYAIIGLVLSIGAYIIMNTIIKAIGG